MRSVIKQMMEEVRATRFDMKKLREEQKITQAGSCEQDTRAHGKLGKATARHAGEDFCNTRQ